MPREVRTWESPSPRLMDDLKDVVFEPSFWDAQCEKSLGQLPLNLFLKGGLSGVGRDSYDSS